MILEEDIGQTHGGNNIVTTATTLSLAEVNASVDFMAFEEGNDKDGAGAWVKCQWNANNQNSCPD